MIQERSSEEFAVFKYRYFSVGIEMKRYIWAVLAGLVAVSPTFGQCENGVCGLRSRVATSNAPVVTLLAAPVVVAKSVTRDVVTVAAVPVRATVVATTTVATTVATRKPVRSGLRALRARICR